MLNFQVFRDVILCRLVNSSDGGRIAVIHFRDDVVRSFVSLLC